MRAIILAAGQGTRLKPLTDDRPKCMVEYGGKPIIDHILHLMDCCGIKDIVIVGGYKLDVLKEHIGDRRITWCKNSDFESTNMVSTLFCARDFMDEDIIISYADIVYDEKILQALMDDNSSFGVVVDRKWRELWSRRMQDPLSDAETMKLSNGYITELGKKPKSYDEVEGQYVGLVKIKKEALLDVAAFYDGLDKSAIYDGKEYANMYMTTLIQLVIDRLMPVKAVMVGGGWIEIDTPSDLHLSPVAQN